MLKSGIVNGVRFPEGVVIDANKMRCRKTERRGLTKIVENTTNEKTAEGKKEPKEEVKDKPKEEVAQATPQERVKINLKKKLHR